MSDIKGYFASSKAGHDKGTVYMILESDDVYVYLSDGKLRPTDKLKKKKLKHVQLIKQKDSDLAEKIEKKLFISNEEIKGFPHTKACRIYITAKSGNRKRL